MCAWPLRYLVFTVPGFCGAWSRRCVGVPHPRRQPAACLSYFRQAPAFCKTLFSSCRPGFGLRLSAAGVSLFCLSTPSVLPGGKPGSHDAPCHRVWAGFVWFIAFMVFVPGALALAFVSTVVRSVAVVRCGASAPAALAVLARATEGGARCVAKQNCAAKQNGPGTLGTGPVGKLVAGTGFEPVTFGL